jgi:hypothetical protein
VKIILESFFSGTIGFSVYRYMAASNASYLDLDSPDTAQVQCLWDWPLQASQGVSLQDHKLQLSLWWTRTAHGLVEDNHDQWLRQHRCSVPGVEQTPCNEMVVTASMMRRPLALAMGNDSGIDVLGMWALFFAVFTFIIWVGLLTHDVALVRNSLKRKDLIFDVTGVNRHCPWIGRICGFLTGINGKFIEILKNLGQQFFSKGCFQRVLGLVVLAVLAPPSAVALFVWNLAVFNFFLVPAIMFAFIRHPIAMSRVWVFVLCIVCSIYGLVLTVKMLAFMSDSSLRPLYALTWVPDGPGAEGGSSEPCTCGCDFPVSSSVCRNLFVVGVATTVKSIFAAVRCLKGLRRCQWANLLLVTFPVPLTVYAVDWRTKDGSIIRGRTEGVPVQSEVAFDPFALMDEQTDSATTTLHLRPEPIDCHRQDGVRRMATTVRDPAPRNRLKRMPTPLKREYYIGCCGFPWPKEGREACPDDGEEDRDDSPSGARKEGLASPEDVELGDNAGLPRRDPSARLRPDEIVEDCDGSSPEASENVQTDTGSPRRPRPQVSFAV